MRKWTILILFLFLCTQILTAKESPIDSTSSDQFYRYQEWFGKPFLPQQHLINWNSTIQTKNSQAVQQKSVKQGLFLSLLLPGSGEVYGNSKLKGIIFFSIEIFAWTSYFIHHKKENDWQDLYIKFADDYWNREKWQNWWDSLTPDQQNQFPNYKLPQTNNNEYYRVIGKYSKFNVGWNDVPISPGEVETNPSQLNETYMRWRNNGSSESKLASLSTGLVLVNHILSALDAAWTVKHFNKNVKPAAKVRYVMIDQQPNLMAELTISW
jgi:hypothetical protein